MQFNQLTSKQEELLFLFIEECGEAIQAATKVLRHGYESRHPLGGPTNRESLQREMGDLRTAFNLLAENDLHAHEIAVAAAMKFQNVAKYLHHRNDAC